MMDRPARRRTRRLLIGGLVVIGVAAVLHRPVTEMLSSWFHGRLVSVRGEGQLFDPAAAFDLSNMLIDERTIMPGGPPKDGIPSLTNPPTVPVTSADFLADDDRVVAVTVDGATRAYPFRILNWHEAVNDTLGGVPIAVVYCPLCDSVSVIDRRHGAAGAISELGVSGLLFNSNVLVYDRRDSALWSQVGLAVVSGPDAGRAPDHLAGWQITSFGPFRAEHADATVLSLDTGHERDYTRNNYASYLEEGALYFPISRYDQRLELKTRVIGVRDATSARAYPLHEIYDAEGGVLTDAFGSGTVELRGDEATGTVRIVAVPDDAYVVHSFWFAWSSFHPETDVWPPPRS